MAAYKEVKGINIQKLSADPPAPIEGQVWYNTTSGALKGLKFAAGAWATGGTLNTGRRGLMGAGTQTAALASGGTTDLSATESYNGTSWTEVNDLGTGRYGGGNGTNTSALVYGGYKPGTATSGATDTESWNGTNWTELNDLNTARLYLQGTGADNTSAIASGGTTPPVSPVGGYAETESWNGTNWTEVNDLNTNRHHLAMSGSQTAALAFGGETPANSDDTESWNGTSWTTVNPMNTARAKHGGAGTQSSTLAFGGEGEVTPTFANTESWNGTNWTEVNDLPSARDSVGMAGTDNTSSLCFAGFASLNESFEWNAGPATVSFDDA